MNDHWIVLTIAAALVSGTPLVFATVGEIISERAGILNLGVQGTMLVGAVAGFALGFNTESVWLGILAAMIAGGLFSIIHAFLAITLRVNQIVSGLALTIFGTGLASFIGQAGSSPLVGKPSPATFEPIFTTGPATWPIVGPIIFEQDIMVFVGWVVAVAASFYLFKTRMGLGLRAVGEDPASADAAGVNVVRVRYAHVIVGGSLSGLAGAYFSLRIVPFWQDGLIGQAGWIAIALVILASWRPTRAIFAAYLFGAAQRLGFTFQTLDITVAASLLAMIPFVLAIIAMIALTSGKRARFFGAPAALGIPYFREQR